MYINLYITYKGTLDLVRGREAKVYLIEAAEEAMLSISLAPSKFEITPTNDPYVYLAKRRPRKRKQTAFNPINPTITDNVGE